MKGWVYVISTKSMHGLVKVGFSTKDPELRAEELNHTGSPHPYVVEYDMLIEDPYAIEQKTHQFLSLKREAKEWFRCSAEEAVAAIKQVSGTDAISETYKRADRAKAEALHQQELEAKEIKRKREERLKNEEEIIRKKYNVQIVASFPPRPFWVYWLGGGVVVFIGLSTFNPKMSDSAEVMLSAILGAVAGWCLQVYFEGKRTQSSPYVALEKRRDEELAAVRGGASSHREPDRNEKWDVNNPGWHQAEESEEKSRSHPKQTATPAPQEDTFLTPVRIAILALALVFAVGAVVTVVSNKPAPTDEKQKLPRSVPSAAKEEQRVRPAAGVRDTMETQEERLHRLEAMQRQQTQIPRRAPDSPAAIVSAEDLQQLKTLVTQGDEKAQYKLGLLYAHGDGVPQDYAMARQWYEKAAVQGYMKAQHNLGVLYANGQGVPQDYVLARNWFEKAAAQGLAKAQNKLGLLYANGDGVLQDYVLARGWYEKAAAQGNAWAQAQLGQLFELGRGVSQDYTTARQWWEKAAAQDNAWAAANIALLYANGLGVPQDSATAWQWWEKAALQGNDEAQRKLGMRYIYGLGVPQDYALARQWYTKAAEQGHAEAQFNLGVLYAKGLGVPQDLVQAHLWLSVAAAQGNKIAVEDRDKLVMKMTPTQVTEAQQLAQEWQPKRMVNP